MKILQTRRMEVIFFIIYFPHALFLKHLPILQSVKTNFIYIFGNIASLFSN